MPSRTARDPQLAFPSPRPDSGRTPLPMLKDFAISLVRTLREHGHQAYFCGGSVRDLLLGREPADYDITSDARPEQVMRIFPRTYAVGEQFGVVLVPFPESAPNSLPGPPGLPQIPGDACSGGSDLAGKGQCIEVATFRSDIGYSDGRHPDQVRFTADPRQDVSRRDFTVNGLLLDPLTGEVLDYVGGRADLAAGRIRAIGDPELRFREDKLRMLRGVRFAARFGYEIDPPTFAAMRKFAPQIGQVSRERMRDELTKMLTEGHARSAFVLLDQSGLLHQVLPELEAMKGVEQPRQYHPEGDVFVHTLLLLEQLPHPCPPTLAWGALLHDVGKPSTFRVAPDRIRFDGHVGVGVKMAEAICRRLRFSNSDTEQILALVENHMRFADVERMKESTFKRFVRQPCFERHLELHRLDCASSHCDFRLYDYTRAKMAALAPDEVRPAPLITGRDLIGEGYTPGPVFKAILAAVEDGQLDGHLDSRQAALEFVRRQFPRAAQDAVRDDAVHD